VPIDKKACPDPDQAPDGRNWHRPRRSRQSDIRHRLRGSVYVADLDGKNERSFLYAQGNLTGIAYAEV